jgi:hypothetical protein
MRIRAGGRLRHRRDETCPELDIMGREEGQILPTGGTIVALLRSTCLIGDARGAANWREARA